MDYLVVSDLHIGGDGDLDIFHSQATLASFLKLPYEKPQTLIINGDFIDFLAVPPFGAFNRAAARDKIQKIAGAASNQEVWASFRAFLDANSKNRIDILLGNHDVELVFAEVQEALRRVMAEPNGAHRIQFLIDRLSYPRLVVGGVNVHVEHGFQYDLFNWYDHNKLIQATDNNQDGTKFMLPAGSRLVYAVLNNLTPNHKFIPLLKPEKAVFWLMVALAPREVFRQIGPAATIGASTFTASLRKYLRGGRQLGASATVPAASQASPYTALQAQLAEMLLDGSLSKNTVLDVEEFLKNGTGSEKPSRNITFASSPRLRGKLFLVRRALKSLKYERDTFFDTTQRDDFESALDQILAAKAQVAIFGHSHGKKMLTLYKKVKSPGKTLFLNRPRLLYVNTGTWADLLDFDIAILNDNAKAQKWLDDLEAGRFKPTLIYTYARLRELSGGRGVRVSLEEWRDNQPHEVEKAQEIRP